ncbi:hypothetical protein [Cohnella nanjingensis]|uniref:Uncharacterized protein n=1 Tax=Cohnella nanjingensis TaxID=1387779 RepID=A0A7X0VD80_9BACL|nr:hypothetical protein [Cohnella nanjingensis]MBB6669712.1 hypothetical protein [Cohnella nanjingensis]
MAAIVCPWCQSELIQEEGQEPDEFCPVCDNELKGYRTLQFGLGAEAEEEEDEEDEDDVASESETDDLAWGQDGDLREKNEALLRYEETVEALLDEQDLVPECPQCREYMLEAGRQTVSAEAFSPRKAELLGGEAVLQAPFEMHVYVCPSCFAMTHTLSDADRGRVAQKLSREARDD